MSDYAQRTASKKITLVELNIGQLQVNWANWASGVWYWIFSLTFPLVDPSLLAGLSAQTVGSVGSVSSDAAQLLSVPDAATCQSVPMSFFYDSSVSGGSLYIHLQNEGEPSLHRISIGRVFGVANQAAIINSNLYEGRLRSAPVIAKKKDPIFFGRVYFDAGWISIDNTDGFFDDAAENQDLFGNSARILQGFDDQPYSQFVVVQSGLIVNAKVGPGTFDVQIKDPRAAFTTRIPNRVLDATTYPNLKSTNVGKSIPVPYGSCRNVPCICLNEAQGGPPATYTFLAGDTTFHQLNAISTVYVNGVAKPINSIDLVGSGPTYVATFTLTNANYTAGQTVTADVIGYQNASAIVIQNAVDVMADLMANYQGIPYIPNAFNQAEWGAAQAAAPNICYFGNTPLELFKILELICMSSRIALIVQGDGRYTARKYSPNRASSQKFYREDLLEIPTIEYDPTQVLTSTMVGYNKDWSAGTLLYLHDISQQAAIYARYKIYLEKQFDTLLTSAADAQAFSSDIFLLAGSIAKRFTARMKFQGLAREIMDFADFTIVRQGGRGLLGNVQAEISGKALNLDKEEITFDGRIVQEYPNTIFVQGEYWGDEYWGDGHWCGSYQEVVA